MDLTLALRAFVRTVERGSMTAAARDLAVSQPAVSKHLRNLEAHMGQRLLERSARLVRTTPQGQRLYEVAQPALGAIDAALEDSRREAGTIEGRVRLHVPSCIGSKHIHPIVNDFQASHPGVSMELVLEDRVIDLVHEDFDLAARYGRPEARNIIVRRIGFIRRFLVAAPSYLDKIGGLDDPRRLAEVNVVIASAIPAPSNSLSLQHADGELSVTVSPILRTNNAQVLVASLCEGRGVGPVQYPLVADALAAGRLVRVLPDYSIRSTEAFMAYPSVRYMRPVIRAFTDFAITRLRAVEGISGTA
ncbi:LysR family transcriptional regulator [Aquabacter sp. P-9]|uniref:LysR family transcriptional regulator n=1 Tax=Aquabacter sediminis TaxID=3029197 RepID=UPI00237ED360|nr:LysR family transcriptional regulator [Aquabacter sp. P-9]MDE1566747.1 LysR family transcriptional regulator [Aquabacter sp. P-9]